MVVKLEVSRPKGERRSYL